MNFAAHVRECGRPSGPPGRGARVRRREVSCPGRTAKPRRGGVLALALVLIAVLGVLAGSATVALRGVVRVAFEQERRAAARWAAQDALHEMAVRIALDTNAWNAADAPWLRPAAFPVRRDDSPGWIEGPAWHEDPGAGLVDAESRISLNTASGPRLHAVFVLAGLDAEAARRLAAAVVAWRGSPGEPETRPAPGGSSDGADDPDRDYRRSGVEWRPARAPLSCLELLRLMPGGDGIDLQRVRPLATVHGGGDLNINTVSPAVLRLVLGSVATGDSAAVERLLLRVETARRAGRTASAATPESLAETFASPGVLRADEAALLGRLLAGGGIGVRSTAYEGQAVGGIRDASGRVRERVRIAFVWDRLEGRIVYWRER